MKMYTQPSFDKRIEAPMLQATFSPDSSQAIADRLVRLPNPMRNLDRGLALARKIVGSLTPIQIVKLLQEFKSDPAAPGTMLLRGAPVDRFLPRTPSDGRPSSEKKTFVSEYVLLWIAQELGEAFAFAEEKDGNLVHDVAPNPKKQTSHSNEGTYDLGYHNEVALSKYRPDYLALLCLRADHEGKAVTRSADIARALPYLGSQVIDDLRRDEFLLKAPESFGTSGEAHKVAVLEGPIEYPEVRVNFDRMEGATKRARQALSKLAEVFARPDVMCQSKLRPGDLLVVNNRKTVHARTAFEAHFDGRDRWLQRIYAASTLWPMRSPDNRSARVLSIHGDYE
jgi:L-asparagine oxygenase